MNALDKDINFITYITYVIPNITKDCGLIFSFDESINFDIDNDNNNYYMIKINHNGIILLEKKYYIKVISFSLINQIIIKKL